MTDAAVQFVRDELEYLWSLLWNAYQEFLGTTWIGQRQKRWDEDGGWSGRCDGLGERIAAATALVGPVSWRNVPMPALLGWFAWANERIGIADPDLPDEKGFAYVQMWVARQAESLR